MVSARSAFVGYCLFYLERSKYGATGAQWRGAGMPADRDPGESGDEATRSPGDVSTIIRDDF